MPELLIILLIAFLIFGAKRLPELGAGMGKAIRSFNKGLKEDDQKNTAINDANDKDSQAKS